MVIMKTTTGRSMLQLLMLAILAVAAFASEAVKSDIKLQSRFLEYLAQHGKTYETAYEFYWRQEIFREVDAKLEAAIASGAVKATTVGHNKFSDRLPEELGGRPTNFDFIANPKNLKSEQT